MCGRYLYYFDILHPKNKHVYLFTQRRNSMVFLYSHANSSTLTNQILAGFPTNARHWILLYNNTVIFRSSYYVKFDDFWKSSSNLIRMMLRYCFNVTPLSSICSVVTAVLYIRLLGFVCRNEHKIHWLV